MNEIAILNKGVFYENPNNGVRILKRVLLRNGVSLSIQASEYHNCIPKKNVNYDKYTHFEGGFPSEAIPELMEYAEEPQDPCNSIYPYVPREVLSTIFNKYGVVGFVEGS